MRVLSRPLRLLLAAVAVVTAALLLGLPPETPAGADQHPATPDVQPATPPQPPPPGMGSARRVDPADIQVPSGYRVEVFATGLSYVTDITFSDRGEIYVAETGDHTYGTDPEKSPLPRILQILPDSSTRVVYDKVVSLETLRQARFGQPIPEEGLIGPVTGVTWHDGLLYVAHRTRVSTLNPRTGEFRTIIDGLPSWGFFHNNKVIFGPDGKMYFFLSTQSNAGPVDAHWMKVINIYSKRDAHEVPCEDVALEGENFPVPVEDPSTPDVDDTELTGVYVPLGTRTEKGQVIPGQVPCNGAFLRANPDGSGLELVAWGLRSNFGYRFSPDGRLVSTMNSGNPIPPREIYEDWETIYEIVPGEWYGWPDYYSGLPVTEPRFVPRLEVHKFVLSEETRQRLLKQREQPPQPLVRLTPNSAAEGFVFGRPAFGMGRDEVLVAEFGTIVIPKRQELPGFRVQRVNLATGQATDFLVNESMNPASATDGGGLERPIQLELGPDGALYVVDFGQILLTETGMEAMPNTGVVWRVTRDTAAMEDEAAADTPAPAGVPVEDFAGLVGALRTAGLAVEEAGTVDQSFFSVTGRRVLVGGLDVQVFEFPDEAAARAAAASISPDGTSIGTTLVTWIGRPHFFQEGRLLVLFMGSGKSILSVLEAVLGRQVAGQ